MKTKPKTQKQQLREWFLKGRSLTKRQALDKFGCINLHGRVNEFKHKEGLNIITEMKNGKDGKRFAKYSLF